MRFFSLYQYIAPAVLFPLAYILFYRRYAGDHAMVLFALALPITFSYVIPAIGMNVLRLWSMRTRLRIGRIRPHHGFMFGSAAAVMALATLEPLTVPVTVLEATRAGLVMAAMIGFWNWLYDVIAIRVGFILVYTRRWALGHDPEALAFDYCPALFGGFGFAYGVWLRVAEGLVLVGGHRELYGKLFAAALVTSLAFPVLLYVAQSWWLLGELGLTTYEGAPPPGQGLPRSE